MGFITYSQEVTSPVPPAKLFKALILGSHKCMPMIVPESIKSIEYIEGDGGVVSIKKINFAESARIKYMKHKIYALDASSFYCKYTMIKSDIKIELIKFTKEEIKFVASGSESKRQRSSSSRKKSNSSRRVCKMTSHYHVEEGCKMKEGEIKKGKDKAVRLFKAVKK